MNIDWMTPFKLAFEVGMFALGSLLLLLIVSVAFILAYGLVKAVYTAITGKNKTVKEHRTVRNLFKDN